MTDEDIKKAIRYRIDHKRIKSGEIIPYDALDALLFRQGNIIGAAINTGETLFNVHNIHPAKSFTLDSSRNILHAEGNFLTLSVNMNELDLEDPVLANRFADTICQFIRLEDNTRKELLTDPKKWAEKMIEYWGNSTQNDYVYAYIAELNVARRLYEAGILTDIRKEYRGPEKSVHDFELPEFSLEVKTHLYGDMTDKANTLTISSENQLERVAGKPLYIVYYRMEETGNLSLSGEVDALVSAGCSKQDVMSKLTKDKYTEGNLYWDMVYHTQNEPQVYLVTDDFPRITPSIFPNGHFPSGIVKLIYTVSLSNIPSCGLTEFINAKKENREPRFIANFNPGVK